MPYLPSPISASPESLRRMRRYRAFCFSLPFGLEVFMGGRSGWRIVLEMGTGA